MCLKTLTPFKKVSQFYVSKDLDTFPRPATCDPRPAACDLRPASRGLRPATRVPRPATRDPRLILYPKLLTPQLLRTLHF